MLELAHMDFLVPDSGGVQKMQHCSAPAEERVSSKWPC